MIEREKQKEKTSQKHQSSNKRKTSTQKSSLPDAGSSTNPQDVKDKDYVERIEDKTSKH